MRIPVRLALAVPVALALATPATSLTIDNFEEGNFNFTDTQTAGSTSGEVSGMFNGNTAGGTRMVRIATTGGLSATGAAVLATTPLDDGALLSTIGVPDGSSTFTLIYDGIPDLLTNGSGGTLGLNLVGGTTIDVAVTATVLPAATVQVILFDNTTSGSASQTLANGVNSFALAGLGLNLAQIRAIHVVISGLDFNELPITVTDISVPGVVPEPGTALLFAAGLVGLAIQRRR